MKKKIGIIGFGNMGSAIGEWIRTIYSVTVFDKDTKKMKNIPDIDIAKSNVDLVNKVEVVILAVKPQDFDSVLNEIKKDINGKLVISIAAGIPTSYIENYLSDARVIRTMPNLLVRIGEGTTFLYQGTSATKQDLNFARELFHYLGKTWIINQEIMMHAATAVIGTGPAVCLDRIEFKKISYHNINDAQKNELIDELRRAAISVKFSDEDAKALAESVVYGIISLLNKEDVTPSELIKQIASRGGTTEAALTVLHNGGSVTEAILAAKKRSEQLSKKE